MPGSKCRVRAAAMDRIKGMTALQQHRILVYKTPKAIVSMMPIVAAAITHAPQTGTPPLQVVTMSALMRLQQRHPQRRCRQRRRQQWRCLQRRPGSNVEVVLSQFVCRVLPSARWLIFGWAGPLAPPRGSLPCRLGAGVYRRGLAPPPRRRLGCQVWSPLACHSGMLRMPLAPGCFRVALPLAARFVRVLPGCWGLQAWPGSATPPALGGLSGGLLWHAIWHAQVAPGPGLFWVAPPLAARLVRVPPWCWS